MLATHSPITLRPAGPVDDVFVADLFAASRPDLDLLPPAVREPLVALQVRAQRAQQVAEHPTATYDIVSLDGQDIGRVVVAVSETGTCLVDLVIAREHRRRGHASTVLAHVLADADAAGHPVCLSVWPTNYAALDLYARHGFGIVPGDGMHVRMRREASSRRAVHE